jgi:hypothetical protein
VCKPGRNYETALKRKYVGMDAMEGEEAGGCTRDDELRAIEAMRTARRHPNSSLVPSTAPSY